ncbi:immunoglobulin-like domain-containing protein [Labilibaculum euxinus]
MAIITLFSACDDKETEDISRITYFPDFTLEGGQFYRHEMGTAYTEPGVVAMEGENELTVTTTGEVDSNVPGLYEIVYSATNVDGFIGTISRYVIVTDEIDDSAVNLSGEYELVNSSLVIFSVPVKKKDAGYYNMGSLYGYEETYGAQYTMPIRFVYVRTGEIALVPLVDIFGYHLTATGTVSVDNVIKFNISRDGTPWSSRTWKKL